MVNFRTKLLIIPAKVIKNGLRFLYHTLQCWTLKRFYRTTVRGFKPLQLCFCWRLSCWLHILRLTVFQSYEGWTHYNVRLGMGSEHLCKWYSGWKTWAWNVLHERESMSVCMDSVFHKRNIELFQDMLLRFFAPS